MRILFCFGEDFSTPYSYWICLNSHVFIHNLRFPIILNAVMSIARLNVALKRWTQSIHDIIISISIALLLCCQSKQYSFSCNWQRRANGMDIRGWSGPHWCVSLQVKPTKNSFFFCFYHESVNCYFSGSRLRGIIAYWWLNHKSCPCFTNVLK